ncbi:hypothetical protein RMSM_06234 [Rhodopirellula maiorica SM1]|uniref:Uncharacterized protein n=1 Tax=Rhodopirellula maiorica SM1 TaxID=1265738 RepID=M5RSB9_9BACT|nr:hypothetical protein RMSM_06234 [Rhodopirellula maiorica SM1]
MQQSTANPKAAVIADRLRNAATYCDVKPTSHAHAVQVRSVFAKLLCSGRGNESGGYGFRPQKPERFTRLNRTGLAPDAIYFDNDWGKLK